MRYIVDISPEMVDVILKEIEKGEYRSVQEFIVNAVQNQIYLIDQPLIVSYPAQHTKKEINEKNDSINYLVLEKTDIGTINPESALRRSTLSGFWNKFLPTKITVRTLYNLIQQNNGTVLLALLQEQASLEARTIGKILEKTEKKSGRKRGDRLFTGLPVKRNSEKSRARFKSHFVGSLTSSGIDGMSGTLRLLEIFTDNDGQDYVQLTNYGKEFSELENPILDKKEYNETLSEKEREYLIQLIRTQLPEEYESMIFILNSIAQGNTDTSYLSREMTQNYPNLSENQISLSLSGALNRLVDLNLVKRRYDSLSFIYQVTEKTNKLMEELEK